MSTTISSRASLQESFGVETMSWKRAGHGSSARPQRPEAMRLRQPQDGALDDSAETHSRVAAIRATLRQTFGEPEDARLTGGTRSLMRRVMGLNVMKPLASMVTRAPKQSAAAAEAPAKLLRAQVA